jgi:general secretion pathway protein G
LISASLRQGPTAFRVRQFERGFTLIELLIVIAILGLLAALAVPVYTHIFGSSKQKTAAINIQLIDEDIQRYYVDVGSFPTADQGLKALVERPAGVAGWNGPYVKDADQLNDPWGHPFIYRYPSERQGHEYDIESLGADGRPGGDGENADVINR